MRRRRALRRGRVVSILVAGSIGYLAGAWHGAATRGADLSAAQAVALRFPLDWQDTPAVAARAAEATNAGMAGNSQLALLSPEPMVPQTLISQPAAPQRPDQAAAAVPQAAGPQAGVETISSAEDGSPAAAPDRAAPQRPMAAAAAITKPATAPNRHRTDRPGFMLNDAQIVSIKQRLHLTADQESMWPAVEAALRNLAYVRAREALGRGGPAGATQLASADPNSVEVQGLKSAAIPLLMSFNDEQKDEVRNLAHVMGLDQLASQF